MHSISVKSINITLNVLMNKIEYIIHNSMTSSKIKIGPSKFPRNTIQTVSLFAYLFYSY